MFPLKILKDAQSILDAYQEMPLPRYSPAEYNLKQEAKLRSENELDEMMQVQR
jgi:hypothetical protein